MDRSKLLTGRFPTRCPAIPHVQSRSAANACTIAIPFDVDKRQPASFASDKSDSVRKTFVTVVHEIR